MELLAGLLIGFGIGHVLGYTSGHNALLRTLRAYAKAKRTQVKDLYPNNEND